MTTVHLEFTDGTSADYVGDAWQDDDVLHVGEWVFSLGGVVSWSPVP